MNPVILLGACAGAGTVTAALRAIQDEAGSKLPVLGYTVPYAIGNILLTAWGPVQREGPPTRTAGTDGPPPQREPLIMRTPMPNAAISQLDATSAAASTKARMNRRETRFAVMVVSTQNGNFCKASGAPPGSAMTTSELLRRSGAAGSRMLPPRPLTRAASAAGSSTST